MFDTEVFNKRTPAGRSIFLLAIVFAVCLAFIPSHTRSQNYRVDLLEVSKKLEVRNYIVEEGKLPVSHLIFGNVGLYPNFFEHDFDLRRTTVEFDIETGYVISFQVPAHYRFLRVEQKRDDFYYFEPRDMKLPGMEVRILSLDDYCRTNADAARRAKWLETVEYYLGREDEHRRKGGLLDLNIPINLPKQLEWFIGKGEETHLSVSGMERITLGGTSRWCSNCPQTEGMPEQRKFPDLDMEQQLTVNVHGTIGEKINVAIDHSSSGGAAESTNRVRINYQGFEDDIIKLIEMGDTDLILSGAQLISYSGSAKGLFGVKTKAQIGPMDLTVIASKEEGESASGSYSSLGGQSTTSEIPDYNFVKRQFFYLENPGPNYSNPGFYTIYPVIDNETYIELFVTLRPSELATAEAKYEIHAYPDPENDGINESETYNPNTTFRKLRENEEYILIRDYSLTEVKYLGIYLDRPLDSDRALAVRYVTNNGLTIGDHGDFDPDIVHTAELICPVEDEFGPDLNTSPFPSTWYMMWRNVYSIGSLDIESGAPEIRIEDYASQKDRSPDIHEKSGLTYLRIFGLDRYDIKNEENPDGKVDNLEGLLDLELGYLIFPSFEPFNPSDWELERNIGTTWSPEDTLIRNSSIYDTLMSQSIEPEKRYKIIVESSSGRKTFQLNAFDIIMDSEVVTLDGVRLTRGVDYDINYDIGEVTLKGDILPLPPGSNVSINYQYKPLIGGGKRSLLGVGADFNISPNSRLNGTFLYNSVGASRYKPRLGDEAGRTMAADINGSFQFEPGWMTSLANLLPRVDTSAKSSLNLSGEVAVSIPNPNIKGEAYIDDMEGIEDSDQISMARKSWYQASPPLDPASPLEKLEPDPDLEFFWYNPARTDEQVHLITSRRDLNPTLDTREANTVTSLFINAINPSENGWCGVMTGIPGGIDLTTAQYLEIWVNDYNKDASGRSGKLHIDFGKIDEDFYEPEADQFNDENLENWTIEDDRGFTGEEARNRYYPELKNQYWDDDWKVYKWINSRVRNGLHDTEDMNRNGVLDQTDAYYTLELDLSDSALIDVQRDFPSVSGYWNDEDKGYINRKKSWRMYRINMSEMMLMTSRTPRLDAVSHLRIWIEGVDDLAGDAWDDVDNEHFVEIAGMKFVGNRWEYNGIRDIQGNIIPVPNAGSDEEMTVKVSTINNKDNPSIYKSPYTVEEEEGIQSKEQSLLLEFENFADASAFKVLKRFYGSGQDYQQYRQLMFFLQGDDNVAFSDSLFFYLQIAFDSTNYYEIEVPVSDFNTGVWYLTTINLSDLTNLKIDADSSVVEGFITDAVNQNREYKAKLFGDPTLFQVRYLFAGARNKGGSSIPEGQIWFNDLQLGDVRKDIDHAERLSFSSSFANILTFSGNWQRTGPEFRSLGQKSGSGVTNSSLSLGGKSELGHFVPTAGFRIPVSIRYGSQKALPKYIPRSDVEIEDEVERERRRTVGKNYSLNVSISKRGSSNFIMKNLFDNLKAAYSYSKKSNFSPYSRDTSWAMSGNLSYQLRFSDSRKLSLFKGIKWRYCLTSITYDGRGSRNVKKVHTLSGGEFIKRPTDYNSRWTNKVTAVYDPFESVKFTYGMDTERDLDVDHNFHGIPVGIQTRFSESMKFEYRPFGQVFILSQFNPSFEYASYYREDLRPNLRLEGDPFGTRNLDSSSNMNISFDVKLGHYIGFLGKLTGLVDKGDVDGGAYLSARSASRKRTDKYIDPRFRPAPVETSEEKVKIERREPAGRQEEPPPVVEESPLTREGEPEKKGALDDLAVRAHGVEIEEKSEDEEKPDDTEQAVEPDSAGAPRYDPMLPLKHLIKLLSRTAPINTRIRIDDSNKYVGLYDRADLLYQLGLTDRSGVEGRSGDIENDPLNSVNTINVNFDSGLDITSNLALDIGVSIFKRCSEYEGRVTESQNLTWPALNANWKGLETWGILENFIERSNMTVKFERRLSEDVNGKSSTYTFGPNWSLTWKNKLSTNLSFSFRQNSRDVRGQESWDRAYTFNFDMRYSIKGSKGFGLPIPMLSRKKIKFESTLNMRLGTGYSRMTSYNMPPTGSLTISPTASYTFSKNVTGSLSMNYKRSSGGVYGRINHEVGMHATAEFKF